MCANSFEQFHSECFPSRFKQTRIQFCKTPKEIESTWNRRHLSHTKRSSSTPPILRTATTFRAHVLQLQREVPNLQNAHTRQRNSSELLWTDPIPVGRQRCCGSPPQGEGSGAVWQPCGGVSQTALQGKKTRRGKVAVMSGDFGEACKAPILLFCCERR